MFAESNSYSGVVHNDHADVVRKLRRRSPKPCWRSPKLRQCNPRITLAESEKLRRAESEKTMLAESDTTLAESQTTLAESKSYAGGARQTTLGGVQKLC